MLTEGKTKILESKWVRGDKIGSGSYGVVYRGHNQNTFQSIAIKKMKTPITDGDGISSETLREIVILKGLEHPNIIKMFDVILANDKMYLIFEYMHYDLRSFIDSFPPAEPIPNSLIKEIMRQILCGLFYLSIEGILHRDLKPQNVLVNYNRENGEIEVKLADFGLARTYSTLYKRLSKYIMTPLYRAPEIFFEANEYSHSIDMWSAGCIFAELVIKTPLFNANTEIDVVKKIFELIGRPDFAKKEYRNVHIPLEKTKTVKIHELLSGFDTAGVDLITKMLTLDPDKRITTDQALEHQFFKF